MKPKAKTFGKTNDEVMVDWRQKQKGGGDKTNQILACMDPDPCQRSSFIINFDPTSMQLILYNFI